MGDRQKGYVPGVPPEVQTTELQGVVGWLESELLQISVFLQEQPYVLLTELHVEPSKPRDGMMVYADGSNWNPGSGEGIYARENGSWVKL